MIMSYFTKIEMSYFAKVLRCPSFVEKGGHGGKRGRYYGEGQGVEKVSCDPAGIGWETKAGGSGRGTGSDGPSDSQDCQTGQGRRRAGGSASGPSEAIEQSDIGGDPESSTQAV